jgi:hypothetical protein
MDIFPFDRLDRRLARIERHGGIAADAAEGFLDIVGIGGLGDSAPRPA